MCCSDGTRQVDVSGRSREDLSESAWQGFYVGFSCWNCRWFCTPRYLHHCERQLQHQLPQIDLPLKLYNHRTRRFVSSNAQLMRSQPTNQYMLHTQYFAVDGFVYLPFHPPLLLYVQLSINSLSPTLGLPSPVQRLGGPL